MTRVRKHIRLLLAAAVMAVFGGAMALTFATAGGSHAAPVRTPVQHASVAGQFKGQIITFAGRGALNSASFNYGTNMIDDTTGNARTLCVPGRNQDPLDTIQLCGSGRPDDNRCVATDPAGSFNLKIEACNAVGSLWSQIVSPGGCPQVQFQNHHFPGRAIAVDGFNGDVAIARVTPIPGWYYNMFGVPLC